MFLPSLIPVIDQAGMEIYAREPAVRDGKVAMRVEVATVLFQGGGEFTLPPIELGWWNVHTRKVEIASIPALVVSVPGAPVPDEETSETAGIETPDWRWLVAGLVVLGVGFWVPRGVRAGRTWWRRSREAEHNPERHAFRALAKSISSQDVPRIDRCLRVWLERLDPGTTLRQLAVDSGVAGLSTRLGQLTRARYGADAVTGGEALRRKNLVEPSRSLRNARSAHRASAHQPLPPQNPTG